MKTKEKSGIVGAGLLTALAASMCCITPILALFTGVSGLASTFSWIEPFRPVLIALTLAVLVFLWHQKLFGKPKEENCECEPKESFMESKKSLVVITLASALLLTFPYYASALYEAPAPQSTIAMQQSELKSVVFSVKGMSCEACTKHIDGAISEVPGVAKSSSSYEKAQTTVSYDPKKVSVDSLRAKISQTGYQATDIKLKSK